MNYVHFICFNIQTICQQILYFCHFGLSVDFHSLDMAFWDRLIPRDENVSFPFFPNSEIVYFFPSRSTKPKQSFHIDLLVYLHQEKDIE